MSDQDVLQRRFDRERRARLEAEALLEQKSNELFTANRDLQTLANRFQEQAERTQAIVDNAAEAIVTLDEFGPIESVNPAAERIFGYLAQELVGNDFRCLVHPDSLDEAEAKADGARSLTWLTDGWHEIIGVRKNGTKIRIEIVSSRMQVAGRNLITAIMRDVTQRKQLETQLAHSQKMESVGQLAAGIAHEINTPIQYVGDNARFLEEAFQALEDLLCNYEQLVGAVEDRAPTLPILMQIEESRIAADIEFLREEVPQAIFQSIDGAQRVAKIVRAMKEFSHPGGEEKQAIDLNRAIESTITVSKNEWKYVAELKSQFDESLPIVRCYPSDLNQAILNMIVNAAHAIEAKTAGNSQTSDNLITVATKHVGELVEIQIGDSGSGIPPELVSKIFDPFFTTKEVGKGTGQGLAIVYSVIVDKHGGSIDVESYPGSGTTFSIRLPISEPNSTPAIDGELAVEPAHC